MRSRCEIQSHPSLWDALIGDTGSVDCEALERVTLARLLRLDPTQQRFPRLVRHANFPIRHERDSRAPLPNERGQSVLDAVEPAMRKRLGYPRLGDEEVEREVDVVGHGETGVTHRPYSPSDMHTSATRYDSEPWHSVCAPGGHATVAHGITARHTRRGDLPRRL